MVSHNVVRVLASAMAAALLLVSCSEEGAELGTADDLEVRAIDFDFDGVPRSVPSGTQLALTNASTEEFHEMVVVRIDDAEARPLGQLIDLPDDEIREVVRSQGVLGALPGEDGVVLRGDTTLGEPGRYGLVCFVPVGADPEAYRPLVEADVPADVEAPDVEGGPAHAVRGMFAELTVE